MPLSNAISTIDALEFARDALLIDLNTIYQTLLEDALKEEEGRGITLEMQQELLLLREAKQKIDEALEALNQYHHQQTRVCPQNV